MNKKLKINKILEQKDKCEEVNENTFYLKDFNMIILTENGKPVFMTYGSEYNFTPTVATISIILNKCEISWGENEKELPLFFKNSNKTIVFYKQNNFWFVIINTKDELPISFLYKVLQLANKKLIMNISGAVIDILKEKQTFDVFSNCNINKKSMIHFQYSLLRYIPFFFDSFLTFPMPSFERDLVKKILKTIQHDSICYIIIFNNFHVINLNSNYDYSINANELNCLLIDINYTLEDNENIYDEKQCIFSLEEKAMFRIFAKYFDDQNGCILITTFQDSETNALSEIQWIFNDIVKKFNNDKIFRLISNYRSKLPLEIGEIIRFAEMYL